MSTDYDKELAAVMDQDQALNEILQERKRQDAKWGEQNHDDKTWLAILMEEIGELSQAMLHSEFGGPHAGTERVELVQVAAVATQWLECMGWRETAVCVCPYCGDDRTGKGSLIFDGHSFCNEDHFELWHSDARDKQNEKAS